MADPLNIVVPVKGLHDGKSRLANTLSPDERASLNTFLADRTLACIANTRPDTVRWVVSPDPGVAGLARRHNANFHRQSGTGLNAGLSEISRKLAPTRTLYIAADLPGLAIQDIEWLSGTAGIAIAPDEKGLGTNALSLPAPDTISFRFGAGSFEAHENEASSTAFPVDIATLPGLLFDLDTKDDLSRLEGWP